MTREELKTQDIANIWALLQTREGARFLSRILEDTGIFSISYVPGDSSATLFKEGMRNAGLSVYGDIMEAEFMELAKGRIDAPNVHAVLMGAKNERRATDE